MSDPQDTDATGTGPKASDAQLGVVLPPKFCHACGAPIDPRAEICPKCGVRQPMVAAGSDKDRVTAILLALFLGWIGIHKFYLGKTVLGIVYVIFFWTGIPSLIAWIEAITYLLKSDEAWVAEYGGPARRSNGAVIGCLWVVALLPLLAILAIISLLFLAARSVTS